MTRKKLLFIISFIEGGAVMVTEIATSKIIAPFFGTSTQIWAIILSSTLIGLALGYFTGGFFTKKRKDLNLLYYVMLLGGLFIASLPVLSQLLVSSISFKSIITTAFVVIPIFLIPPIFFMGMMSPILIFHLCDNKKNVGYYSGLIYAISTCGGILSTILFGIFILPNFGVINPLYITGSILILISVFYLFLSRKKNLLILLVLPLIHVVNSAYFNPQDSGIKVHYSSSGIQGQLKVLDYADNRFLLLNNTVQAVLDLKNPDKDLIFFIDALNKTFENNIIRGNKVLIFGLGGGIFANKLSEKYGLDVTVVDIDSRMEYLARNFFSLSDNVKVINMDARNYINYMEDGEYDIIMFDTFLGEYIPSHLFTIEALTKVKEKLNPNGVLITDFHGYFQGDKGKGARSIVKTLDRLNFKTIVTGTSQENSIKRSLLFFSTPSDESFANLNQIKKLNHPTINVITYKKSSLNDAEILSDYNMKLDILMNEIGIEWREYLRKTLLKEFNNKNYVLID